MATAAGERMSNRITCPKCGNWTQTLKDGTLRRHRICCLWHTRQRQPDCSWSGKIVERFVVNGMEWFEAKEPDAADKPFKNG